MEEDVRAVDTEIAVDEARPFLVAGVPALNEEKTIASVVLKARRYVDEVVVCDDGSSDLTAEIAERLGATVVRHDGNLGYGAAIRSLFKRARELGADVLITLDADGQHDPSEIPEVVKPIVNGTADIVIGSRFIDDKKARLMPWYRRAGVKFITRLVNNASGKQGVKDAQSGFRVYSSRSLEALTLLEDGMGVSAEILLNAEKEGLRICEVSSTCNYGDVETSTHNPMRHLFDVVMSIVRLVVEKKPLTLLGIPGIICLLAGSFFGAWMLQIYAVEHRIVTNIALASIAFILIGFFCLSTAITLYAILRLVERTKKGE